MKTKRDIVVALIIFCTGAIIAVLFFSHQNLNILTTNLLQATNTNQSNFKNNISNTANYAMDATSDNIVKTFPGKKLSEITYQPPCSEPDINQSEDYYTQPSMAKLNDSRQISNANPTKTRLILSIAAIIFCLLTEFYANSMKSLKKHTITTIKTDLRHL